MSAATPRQLKITSFDNKMRLELFMISIISGGGIVAAGGVGLWYFMPHNGQLHWHTKVPGPDSIIPVMIVAAFGAGVALIISGVAGMMM